MRMMLEPRKISLLLVVLYLPLSVLTAQFDIGKPFIQNYTFRDYNAASQNWWAIEDDRGIMYFANGTGVLEFDGENWSLMQSEWLTETRSIAKDEDGTLYVGLGKDLGYLSPGEDGKMKFVSLKDKLPPEEQNFNIVWEVDYWNGNIYYRSTEKLFKWDGEAFTVITAGGNFHVGKVIHGKYIVRVWNVGLCELVDDEIRLLPGGEFFADKRVYVMLPYDDNTVLLGDRDNGKFYLYDYNELTRFPTELDAFVQEAGLYLPGLVLPNGNFAFNMFGGGIYIVDREGKLVMNISKEDGLNDETVTYMYIDSRGILWATTFNGISSINLNSNFTYVDASLGLPSVVFDMEQHNGMLYAGSNNGIYYYNDATKKFLSMEGTFGQTTLSAKHRGRLYYGSGGMGIIEVTGKTFKFVRESKNYDFRVSQIFMSEVDPDRMYVHMQQGGISSLYYDEARGTFIEESFTDQVDPDFGAFMEDSLGNVWTQGLQEGIIVRIEPHIENNKLDFSRSKYVIYDSDNGLPSTPLGFWAIDGILDVISGSDIYGFDAESERFEKKESFYADLFEPNAISF
ncbi:MAG: hypothetical protein KJP00_15605, partial [Bacteroidia bacterium]|nr:hypothetical protein [Bacteroidia bacterium]